MDFNGLITYVVHGGIRQQTKYNHDGMNRLAQIVGEYVLMIDSECSKKEPATFQSDIQTLNR